MSVKQEILNHICYSELVYERINKKLKLKLTKTEIESLIIKTLRQTEDAQIKKTGKNYYAVNKKQKIKITINANTFRVITVDRI